MPSRHEIFRLSKIMKRSALLPALLTICSAASAVVFQSLFTYFNLALAIVLLCIAIFSRSKATTSRIRFSALWLFLLELAAFVLLLFGVNVYQPTFVWILYVAFVAIDIFVTPQISKTH